jgi:O-antigen/teichoic acid export membrane protein
VKEKNQDSLLKNSLLKNSVLSFLLNVSSTAISFFAIPVSLKIIGIEGYGSFVFVQSAALIAFTLSTVQYWQGLLVELPGKSEKLLILRQQVLRSIGFEALGFTVAFVALLLFAHFQAAQFSQFSSLDLLLIVVSTIFPSLGSVVAFFRLTDKYQVLMASGLCANLLRLALLYAALHFSPTPSAFIAAYAVPELLRFAYLGAVVLLKRAQGEDGQGGAAVDGRKVFTAGCWSMGQAVADLPVANVDKILVGLALSPEALGIYNILKRLYSVINMATAPVYMNSIPEFSRKVNVGDVAGAFALWRKTIGVLLPVSTVIGLSAYLSRSIWMPFIYRGLAGHSVELAIVVATSVVAGSFITTHSLFWALGKRMQTTLIAVGCNIFYLGVLLGLSSRFGLVGAVSAFLIHVLAIVSIKVVFLLREKRNIV